MGIFRNCDHPKQGNIISGKLAIRMIVFEEVISGSIKEPIKIINQLVTKQQISKLLKQDTIEKNPQNALVMKGNILN
jgi:hypothetical protein